MGIEHGFVTGSTSGIGLGIAQELMFAGASVVINGFGKPKEINATVESLQRETGARAVYSGADLTKPSDIDGMVNLAEETFGSLDILVNNAGIFQIGPIDQFPVEKWDAVLAVNLSSAFHTTRLALPMMRRQGWGRIINVASALALVGSPLTTAHCSTCGHKVRREPLPAVTTA